MAYGDSMANTTASPESAVATSTPASRMIPAGFEPLTRVPRQLGGMTGGAFGAGLPSGTESTMDAATTAERRREGGGSISERG